MTPADTERSQGGLACATVLAGHAQRGAPGAVTQGLDLLQAALWYARAGFSVIPCRVRGKAPLTAHGVKDATCDLATIRVWWQRWPAANVGLEVPAGFVVVDVDGPEGLAAIHATGDGLPATAWATTGRGSHHWYTLPDGVSVRNAVRVLPGVDLRASGGFVVGPPSVHPSGTVYRWEEWPDAFAEAPSWLLPLAPTGADSCAKYSADRWRGLIAGEVPSGRRNDTLARVAGHLLRHYVSSAVAETLLLAFNRERCRPPLPDREVLTILASVGARELSRRERVS